MVAVLGNLIDALVHFDKYLGGIVESYGTATYALLFAIIFLETGLVITPFLPGDSLLFAAGAFAGIGSLNVIILLVLLSAAAIIGDAVNYHIGKAIGERLYKSEQRLIKKEYIDEARVFYERYGPMAIVLGRFVPIIRTFVPFVAGIGQMRYSRFLVYNALGGICWVALFTLGGYYFGGLQIVKENFGLVAAAIIAISVMPAVITFIRTRRAACR
ncbi:MAG: DedA family protein [Limnochordales bacterium]|nr:DedA family protein [Limnochordales bacterium]